MEVSDTTRASRDRRGVTVGEENEAVFLRDEPNPRPILALVDRVERTLRRSWVVTGIALTLGLLLTAVIVTTLADIAFPLGTSFRVAALVIVCVPTLYALIVGVFRPYLRRVTKVQVARRIEKHLPNIHNRLVSCVDLASDAVRQAYSLVFYRRLVVEVLQRIRGFRPKQVVDRRSRRQALLIAAVALCVFAALVGFFPRTVLTAIARILIPMADIPPASDVRFTVVPGNIKALIGDPVTFAAQVEQGDPKRLQLHMTSTEDGQSRWHGMEKNESGLWTLTLTGLEHSADYRIHGGGTWSREYRAIMLDRPRLEEINTVVHYPAYMGLDVSRPNPPQTTDVTGPKFGEAEVIVTVGGDVSHGQLQLLKPREKPGDGEAEPFEVTAAYPMAATDDGRWAGRFALEGTGFYRVEMRNSLGHANKPMREARYTAIIDTPPQVTAEQPGVDLVLSEVVNVPLVVAAYDDYALDEVSLVVQVKGKGQPQLVPIRKYETPPRSDTVLSSLELTAMDLQQGDVMTYYVAARDRAGQTARSREFTVRLAAEGDADDVKLAQFDESQDEFKQKLIELTAGTGELGEALKRLKVTFITMPGAKQEGADAAGEAIELDPETAKRIEAVREALGEIAGQAKANVELARELDGEMNQSVEQMAELQMMPAPLAEAMRQIQQVYENMALNPMADLARMADETTVDPEPLAPIELDLDTLVRMSERLTEELGAVQSRMGALDAARENMGDDLRGALAELEQQMLVEQAGTTEREVTDLQAFLADMQEDFGGLKGEQEDLLAALAEAEPKDLEEIAVEQDALEEQAEPALEEARKLLDTDALLEELRARQNSQPEFPAAPYTPDTEKYFVPPAEEDVEEPEEEPPPEPDAAAPQQDDKVDVLDVEEEEPLYLPALGGPQAVMDPRFSDMRRPVAEEEPSEPGKPQAPAEALRDRQQGLLDELDMADRSVSADHETLRGIVEELTKMASTKDQEPTASELRDALSSEQLQQALAMSDRVRQLLGLTPARPSGNAPNMPAPPQAPEAQGLADAPAQLGQPSNGAAGKPGVVIQVPVQGLLQDAPVAASLDPATRRIILRMQPKAREELLQGMRERGPEGYHEFIQDYFKKLARVRQPN
jgi:hypothetical protein